MQLTLAIQLFKNMGPRYFFYRAYHQIVKITGQLKKKHPGNLTLTRPITKLEWLNIMQSYAIQSREDLNHPRNPTIDLGVKANRLLNGEFLMFNNQWIEIGKSYNWTSNPLNSYQYDIEKHWSEIPDLSPEAGDIKQVWEKSRFSYLLTLIRYDYHFEEDLAEFVFNEIESWINANPINHGPNWRCSQEISLRIFNWCYALYYYQNSKALSEERWQKIQQVIYASLHHVYHHIHFSRIAVRNNHAITETLFLTLSNILFPFIPETKQWSNNGLRWFEEEVNYQIYNDGTFLQFSMNYHRVVIQLLSLGISVFKNNNVEFSDMVYQKAYKSVNFLYQCMQDENGRLPNYGSNDGALFFPLSDTDYGDFRPQLNTLHKLLTGEDLFSQLNVVEDYNWLKVHQNKCNFPVLSKISGVQSFDVGGYYVYRSNDFFTFIRCGNHIDRPAQADNLHVDIWYRGQNILRDSGTYSYNTDKEKLNYFMGSESHNVVMVNNHSQMLKGGRFIWYYWTQKIEARWEEENNQFVFKGKIRAFMHLNHKATFQRTIIIDKVNPQWTINDSLNRLDNYSKKQIWHPNSADLEITSNGIIPKYFNSMNSDYYGNYSKEKSLYFEFDSSIKTVIKFSKK